MAKAVKKKTQDDNMRELYDINRSMKNVADAESAINKLKQSSKLNPKALQELNELQNELLEVSNSIDEAKNKMNEEMKPDLKTIKDIYNGFYKAVEEQIASLKEKGASEESIAKSENILKELDNSVSLDYLKSYSKVRKTQSGKRVSMNNLVKDGMAKLGSSSKYRFRHPNAIKPILYKVLKDEGYTESDVKNFYIHFMSFVINHNLDDYAVFYAQFISNIYLLQIDSNEQFLNNVKEVIAIYK